MYLCGLTDNPFDMRKIYFTLVCIALCGLTFAQSVTQQEAAVVAQRFLESQGKTLVRCAKVIGDAQNPALYIFNAENGFVVVSGDKNVPPVLSFSDQQLYSDADVVPPFEMWINHYASQIEQIRRDGVVQDVFVSQWEKALSGAPVFRSGDEVEPLLHSKWDQGEYFNYYCPRDLAGDNGRVVTGCVATAMAQLLYYYRFPESGVGSYSYTDEHYGVQSADYGNAIYDYNAMCDVPSCINTEISKLIYHCGVGVDMHYGPDGSGMTNHSAARVLRTYFKFSPETEYLFRDSTDLNWDSVIVSHLNRRMPLYYAGWSVPDINGHGFICDGYKTMDSSYYFHFNFGWSGYMDNYYYTNSLYVGSSNFNLAQELIINAYPDTTLYAYPTPQPLTGSMMLTSRESTFTDGGSDVENCPAGMDFSWHINPDSYNLTGFSLNMDYNIAAGDTLYILSEANMGVPQAITADTGVLSLDLMAIPSFHVRLVTHTAASEGFRAHYTAHYTEFCSGTKNHTSITGTITDGSESHSYNNLTNCKFRVLLTGVTATQFHINSLDLETGHDFLRVYDGNINEANLHTTLTGHISDSVFVVNSRRIFLVLETDESGTDAGFSIDYAGGFVGIDEHAAGSLLVYPNPATDKVTVSHSTPIQHVEIRNAEGRTIYAESPNSETFEVQTNNWSSGIYIMTVQTEDAVLTRKIVKW